MMIRARIRIALSALSVLGVFPVACHKHADVRSNADVGPVIKDTARVATITDTSVIALFKDTAGASVFAVEGQTFKLPSQRQSVRAAIRKERELWQAGKPADYKFLLRVGCFCPGPRGWLLMDVRNGQPLRAWDRAGKSAALTDWNTFSIDGLYDNLERSVDINGQVQIAFAPRWHFPKHVYTVVSPGPDAWSIIEVRGFRASPATRPTPPTRDPHTPGFVTAKELPDGSVPSVDVNGNFIIGPTHAPAFEMVVHEGAPRGAVHTFTMRSVDSKIFPGIARDSGTSGTVSPTDPATLVVTTSHPAPYTRTVAVYVPAQYVRGTIAPFIVGTDGPGTGGAVFGAGAGLMAGQFITHWVRKNPR